VTDQPYPPHWDRSIVVVFRPSLVPYFPFVLWCGECHRIINTYETPIGAALFAHRHHDHGGHHTMPPQTITPDAVTEALVEWIADETGETNPIDVRLTPAGDALVCTYKHGDPATYAALIVDDAMRATIDAHVNGASA
jgi:hypothetical protein